MPATKIDFEELRRSLDFSRVLTHYNAYGRWKSEQWTGRCPLPDHEDKKASFSANSRKNVFNCFGCGGKGNILDFVLLMEKFDPEDPQQVRQGALRAQQLFLAATAQDTSTHNPPTSKEGNAVPKEREIVPENDIPTFVNVPLGFELQELDPKHPYLQARGLSEATIAHFGLGYAGRGIMKGRIAIPIKNEKAELVGYAGRLVDESTLSDENPKYRFPSERIKDGVRYSFHKSQLLYHSDTLLRYRSKYLFLVEGFPSVWWWWQGGVPSVAAVMGASMSERQVARVCDLTTDDARIILIPDGDAAGERLAESALKLLAKHRFVHCVQLLDKMQPTDCDPQEFLARFTRRT